MKSLSDELAEISNKEPEEKIYEDITLIGHTITGEEVRVRTTKIIQKGIQLKLNIDRIYQLNNEYSKEALSLTELTLDEYIG